MKCAYCDSEDVKLKKNEELEVELKNPGKIELHADFYKCLDCGEKYLDEKNMEKVAKKIDEVRKTIQD